MIQVAVLLCCAVIALSLDIVEDRKNEFDRIKKYETIHPVFDDTNSILEFDAFSQHYKIQLEVNQDISPVLAYIMTEDGESVPYEQSPEHYQCHYRGIVLNAESSFVALSLCPGSGVSGSIRIRGQTLYLHAMDYFLDPLNEAVAINDEHIIYYRAAYVDPDWNVPHMQNIAMDWDGSVEATSSNPAHYYNNPLETSDGDSTRRRLAKTRVIELYVLMDNSLYELKRSSYSQTIQMAKDVVNEASGIYESTRWPYPVGTIKFKLVHVEVNRFKKFCGGKCRTRTEWAGKFKGHMKQRHPNAKYDYAYGFFFRNTNVGGGGSYPGKICQKPYNVGVGLGTSDQHRMATTLTHEAGHNQGLNHDTVTGCCPPQYKTTGHQYDKACCNGPISLCVSWIMDKSGSGDTFSPCSKTEMKDIYSGRHATRPQLSCLLQSYTRYSENKGGDGSQFTLDVNADGCSKAPRYADEMCFYSESNDEADILRIEKEKCFGNETVYSFVRNETDYYLFYTDGWIVAADVDDPEQEFVCFAKDLNECGPGQWSTPLTVGGDMLTFEVNDNVWIKPCNFGAEANAKLSNSVLVVIILVVLLVIVSIAFGVFIYRRNRSKYIVNSKKLECNDEEVEEEEEVEADEDDETQTIDVDLPQTVN